jgi:hypothetical protein
MTQSDDDGRMEDDRRPMLKADANLGAPKDGTGLGSIVDDATVDAWVVEYLQGRSDGRGLAIAFRYGVAAEGRRPGQSFLEAEPVIRSEWSSERGRLPWEIVRDAVWAGFDRARNRNV